MYKDRLIEKRSDTIKKGGGSSPINKHLVFLEKNSEAIHGKNIVPTGKLEELPSSLQYYGTGERTKYVSSEKVKVIAPNENYDGLYTTGVNTCTALIIVAKDPEEKVLGVMLAHIGVLHNKQAIKNLFTEIKIIAGQGAKLESSVIGGKSTALLVLKIAKEEGAMKFEFVDSDQSIGHSVVVDKNGTIYYGRRFDLDLFSKD